jgi:CelD/BcsL family acetyltransferase involved in cellulose biosynthesis
MLGTRRNNSGTLLTVSTLTASEELQRIASEWTDLVSRTEVTLPFVLPEWLITWWETFRQDRPLIRDFLHVKVVRDVSGRLVGIVPFMLTERPSFGPIRARVLAFLGADEYITEQCTPLVDPAFEAQVARALAANLCSERVWDWIHWRGLDRASTFAQTMQGAMSLQRVETSNGNLLRLAPSWGEFRSGLKRNIKESLRRCYNSLKRDGLTMRLEVAESPAHIAKALDTFFELHAMRASQEGGVTHPNRFRGDRSKCFLRTVCARLAARQSTRVFKLYIGESAVAARIGFVLPNCLYLYYSGFDPVWSKYSVMTTTVAETIKYAIERKLSWIHLSMGLDVSKSRWGPQAQAFDESLSVRSQYSSQAALKLYSWGRQNLGLPRGVERLLPKRLFD